MSNNSNNNCGCNQTTVTTTNCVPNTVPDCSCPVKDLSTECVLYTGTTLPNSGIQTNTILTNALQALDAYIDEATSQINDKINLVNVGEETGMDIYAGINNVGKRKIKRLSPLDDSILLTQDADNIYIQAAGAAATTWGGITGTLSDQTDLNAALNLKASLNSPIFTGDPQAPTAAPGDNDTSIATTAFVTGALATLDTNLVHKTGTETIVGTKTFISNVTANSFIKSGGLASQFLKADGSTDSSVYVTYAAVKPYKVYTALLVQDVSTDPVTPVIMENTIGVITIDNTTTGIYKFTSAGLFTSNKTVVFFSVGDQGDVTYNARRVSNNEVWVNTAHASGSFTASNRIGQSSIEIRVYD